MSKPRSRLLDVAPWAAATLLLLCTSGCTRTITWEEEVPLNTGETIWIERSMPWAPLGSQGNPFDIGMRPTREQTIRFKYHSRDYEYTGSADVTWIAVSPTTKEPVLIAPASNFAWDTHNKFYCVVPHYVQLVPDNSRVSWTWPPKIEPWLYGLQANVMASIPSIKEQRTSRFTQQDRDQRDATYRTQFPPAARIDPLYRENACVVKFGR